MKKLIDNIREFQEKLAEVRENIVFDEYNKDSKSILALDRIVLRGKLAQEEFYETQKAVMSQDKVGTLDGLVDQLYILMGTVHEYGMLDKLEKAWDLVHANNMTKLDENGKVHKDESGKVIKPSNYKPVDLKVLF